LGRDGRFLLSRSRSFVAFVAFLAGRVRLPGEPPRTVGFF
jgi:hypothetical protein